MSQQYERATYSIPEAAQIIGIGLSLCRQLVRKGDIPAKVLGRRVVIPKKALNDWLGLSNNAFEEEKTLVGEGR